MRFFEDEVDLTNLMQQCASASLIGLAIDWPAMQSDRSQSVAPYLNMFLRFRVSRLSSGSRFIGMDGEYKRYRNYGSVMAQVVGPQGEGPGRLMGVIDVVSTFFASRRQGGMLCQTPSAGPLQESGSTVSVTVSVPYMSDFKVNAERQVIP